MSVWLVVVIISVMKINQLMKTILVRSNPEVGVVNLMGPTATMVVNSSLVLARTNVVSTAAANSTGTLSVYDGTVRANTITRGANGSPIGLTNALLIVTNVVGTPCRFRPI